LSLNDVCQPFFAAEVKAAPVKKTGKAKMDEKVDDPGKNLCSTLYGLGDECGQTNVWRVTFQFKTTGSFTLITAFLAQDSNAQ